MGFTLWQNFYAIGKTLAFEHTINDNFIGRKLTFNAAASTDHNSFFANDFAFDKTIYLDVTA